MYKISLKIVAEDKSRYLSLKDRLNSGITKQFSGGRIVLFKYSYSSSNIRTRSETTRSQHKFIDMPKLWKTNPSPPSCAVRVLGDILGIQFDYVDIDFGKLEHKSPEFIKINPLGTIPLLQDGDFILADSHAMLKYLLEKYGTADQRTSLYPSSLQTRALIDQAMFSDAAVFFIRLKNVALPSAFGDLTGPTPKHIADIEDCYSVVEAYLGSKKYIAAEHLTLADISVGTTTASIHVIHQVDKSKFPRTSAWLGRLNQLPEFTKYTGPGFKNLRERLETMWERNKLKH